MENQLHEFINKGYLTLYDVYKIFGLRIPMGYMHANSLENIFGVISYEDYFKSVGWALLEE